jgi:hypothetical protein
MTVEQRFETVVGDGGQGDGSTAFLEVPTEVIAALGERKRPPVQVTINGYGYRSTVAVYDGKFYLPVRREVREGAGVTQGQTVSVALRLDDAPREIRVPDDLDAALAARPETRARFEGLSFSHRKEYVDWIEGARREETRRRRIEQAVEMLRDGRKTPKG